MLPGTTSREGENALADSPLSSGLAPSAIAGLRWLALRGRWLLLATGEFEGLMENWESLVEAMDP